MAASEKPEAEPEAEPVTPVVEVHGYNQSTGEFRP